MTGFGCRLLAATGLGACLAVAALAQSADAPAPARAGLAPVFTLYFETEHGDYNNFGSVTLSRAF